MSNVRRNTLPSERQGNPKGGLQCRVKLLDGGDFHLDLDVSTMIQRDMRQMNKLLMTFFHMVVLSTLVY